METDRQYLRRTPLLDYDDVSMVTLVERKQWMSVDEEQRLRQIYNFVKDEIKFGYNVPGYHPGLKGVVHSAWRVQLKNFITDGTPAGLRHILSLPCLFDRHFYSTTLALDRLPVTLFNSSAPRESVYLNVI